MKHGIVIACKKPELARQVREALAPLEAEAGTDKFNLASAIERRGRALKREAMRNRSQAVGDFLRLDRKA